MECTINPAEHLAASKPRSKSFEVMLVESGVKREVWTGVKKGPPRSLKFPDHDKIVEAVEAML